MRIIPARASICISFAILTLFLLIPSFAAFSGGVVAARETALELTPPTAATEAYTASPAAMQGPVMGCSTPSFSAPSYFGIGGGTIPVSIAVADFNLDGKPDLVTGNQTTHNISVLLGNGSGNFPAATTVASGAVNPTSVAVADFNLDGKPDVTVSNISGSVSVLLGNGSGGFGAPLVLATGSGADEVVTGDFNGDGKPDLAAARGFANGVSIFLGNGIGGFGARTDFAAGTICFSLRAADFNGDGKLDIATANSTGNNVSILLGNGSGGMSAPTTFPVAAGSNPRSIRFGDFDQDGDMDLVTANNAAAGISVLLNNGSGSFGAATFYATATSPLELTVGDLNNDGKPDIAVTNSGASNCSVLLGNGSGSFGAATNLPVNNSVRAVNIADLNLDGRLDLVMRSAQAVPGLQNVAVLLNTCSAVPCSNIAFAEAMGSPYSQGTGSTTDPIFTAVGDFNRDGKPDVAVANFGTNNVMILLGNGTGSFTPAAGSPFAAGPVPQALAVGDYNQDGIQDLAAASGVFPGQVNILLGNGSGGFALTVGSPIQIGVVGAYTIATADFNADGKLDLATANSSGDSSTILLGNGMGGFTEAAGSPFAVGANPRGITVSDFNLDGKPDLATANSNSDNVTILLNNGSASFTQAAGSPLSTGGIRPAIINSGDFNLDGKADLVVGNQTSHDMTILLGDGMAGFTPAAGSPIAGTFAPRSVIVSDFTVDGKPDILVALSVSTQMAALKGNGNGGFAFSLLSVPGAPFGIAAGDFNLDGRPDVAASDVDVDNLRILLNTCPQNAPPSISATPLTLQQTAFLSSTQIATVSDAEDAETSLAVTVNGSPSATLNGVTVSNITVDAMGVVRADVSAACGSSNASFTLAVTDTKGASSNATLNVTVTPETSPPALTCPQNISQSTDPGQCSAIISFTTPTASDNCPGATVLCSPLPGSSFLKGTTTVTCTATDAAGNTAQCSFTVTINDTENPVVTCPLNITQSTDNNQCQAVVIYPKFNSTDNCEGIGTTTCNPASGSTFQKGTTTVNCSVTDAAGNSGSCSFTVTINDTQNPTITCPANVTVPATTGQCQAVVNYSAPSVSDNCSGVGTPTCTPAAGSTFQKGTTTVNCSVTDAAGNTNTCSFTVTVNDTQNPTVICPANISIVSNVCVSNAYTVPTGSDNCAGVSVVCNPPPGTCFASGTTTTVNCTATDAVGLTGTCSFTVAIVPCTITCPANVTQNNDQGQCGAVVNFAAPTTTGSCGTVSCSPASGSFFPKGTTTVTCTTTVGPSCTFTVTVNDTQPPALTCPANIVSSTAANQCQASVNYALPTVTDNCSGVGTPVCSPPSGAIFQKGVTTVNCSVSDAAGLQANCSFTVTVNDTQNPTISCPANISMPATTGSCSRVISYANATATDNCSGVGTPGCTPPSGSTFQKGVTTVTCTVSDASKNSASCSFTVTITDTQAPTIVCPVNQTRGTDAGLCSAVVSYPAPNVTDNCPGATAVCTPPSGSTFPKGVTTVSCAATDAAGLTASCSFTVTVNDTQPPTLNCPANLIRVLPPQCATTPAALTVTYSLPTASDNCPGTAVVCNPPSGTAFPTGTTAVNCTATDASGNTATCSFKVKVFDACLQDNSNSATVILWNTTTGEYAFCCGGQVYLGTGVLSRRGCTVSLVHNTLQLRVSASIDFAMSRGSASIQSPPGSTQCSISDSDITNNTCNCSFNF
jgi:hypothetical protein